MNNTPFLSKPTMEDNNNMVKTDEVKPFLSKPTMEDNSPKPTYEAEYVPAPVKPETYLDKIGIWDLAKQSIKDGWEQGKQEANVEKTAEQLAFDTKETLMGAKASAIGFLNMVPGFNEPVVDHDNLAFQLGKGVTDAIGLLVPVVGVEATGAKLTATALKGVTEALGGGEKVYEALSNNFLNTLVVKGARATIGGALFGLEEAYHNQANNNVADYEKSIRENALFGLAGAGVFHYGENIYAKYMNKELPDFMSNINKIDGGAEYKGSTLTTERVPDVEQPIINTEPVAGIITKEPDNIQEIINKPETEGEVVVDKMLEKKPALVFADVKDQLKEEIGNKYKKYANYKDNKLSPKTQSDFENRINNLFEEKQAEITKYNEQVDQNLEQQRKQAQNLIAENNANKIISQYNSSEEIYAHVQSQRITRLKEFDNVWANALEKHGVKNAEAILSNKQFELPIMKLVRGFSTGSKELNENLMPIANAINDYNNHIFQSMKEVNPEIREVKGYVGTVTHDKRLINNNLEEWDKFVSDAGLMQQPLSKEEKEEFTDLITRIKKTASEQLRTYDFAMRRFKFNSPDAEFAYNNQFGNADTLFNRVKSIGDVASTRISAIKTLGVDQELTLSKIGQILKDPDGAQKIANTLFPVTLGHFNNQAQIINAINLSSKANRLLTSVLNPNLQIFKYIFEDMTNNFTNVMKNSSILNAIKDTFNFNTPEFVKELSSLNEFDKRTIKGLMSELKVANEKAVNKGMNFFEVGGSKADNYGSFLENINSKINGSHTNDTILRNKAGTSYATLLRNLNKSGKLQEEFPTIPPEYLEKFIDKDGNVNPYLNKELQDAKTKQYSEDISSKYIKFIEDVNPVYTKSSIIASADSVASLLPVKMTRWTQTVTSRTMLPLMKEFATSKGLSKAVAGGKWVMYASTMTAISEAFRAVDDWIDGKEHKVNYNDLIKDFLAFGTFGGMYWTYKLSYSKSIALGKSGYYGAKASLYDDQYSDKQFEDYMKSKENMKKASYIFRTYCAIHDKFIK